MNNSAKPQRYTELEAWKSARSLVKWLYQMTTVFPQQEQYGLASQLRRAAVSVPSNIAEGIGRKTSKDTTQFLYISRGSLYEIETQLYLSLDLGHIPESDCKEGQSMVSDTRKMLSGLINHYKKLP